MGGAGFLSLRIISCLTSFSLVWCFFSQNATGWANQLRCKVKVPRLRSFFGEVSDSYFLRCGWVEMEKPVPRTVHEKGVKLLVWELAGGQRICSSPCQPVSKDVGFMSWMFLVWPIKLAKVWFFRVLKSHWFSDFLGCRSNWPGGIVPVHLHTKLYLWREFHGHGLITLEIINASSFRYWKSHWFQECIRGRKDKPF